MAGTRLALQSRVRNAVQGATKGGLEVARVEVAPDGTVIVYTPSASPQDAPSPLDQWRRDNGQG
jgi:hypothetical protein